MKIVLTNSKSVALVDTKDYKRVNQFHWYLHTRGYAYGMAEKKHISMHRFILKPPHRMMTDHINGNGLDNRRSNLRICTNKQNQGNANVRIDNKSGYRGVSISNGKFIASIRINGKKVHLGYFINSIDAAIAYNNAAIKEFGEFANLNIIS